MKRERKEDGIVMDENSSLCVYDELIHCSRIVNAPYLKSDDESENRHDTRRDAKSESE